ncbi:MAG TPA: ATP-binding cassette domain-containing protein [Archaeoglobaceae archaeon]|nr:ATP-binding cassette domain-containing protein [Archaeoglobaceae archaeon]
MLSQLSPCFSRIGGLKIGFAVVIKDLYKKFGKKEVFRGLNLKVPKGCFFCILGENGSGKTTLLNVISGSTDYQGEV